MTWCVWVCIGGACVCVMCRCHGVYYACTMSPWIVYMQISVFHDIQHCTAQPCTYIHISVRVCVYYINPHSHECTCIVHMGTPTLYGSHWDSPTLLHIGMGLVMLWGVTTQ